MKKLLLAILVLLAVFKCQAHHIIGGEMFYNYVGKGTVANTSVYLITLKLFRDQNAPPGTAPMPSEVYIGIYNNDNGQEYPGPYPYYIVPKNDELPVTVDQLPPCISNAPNLSYHVGIFLLTVQLPDDSSGYTASFQTCCRVDNISNVMNVNGVETGSTFSCSIPPAIYKDNSPEFTTSIDVICGGKPFSLKFNATDADGDSLVYSFVEAYDGGAQRDASNANPPPPPYNSVIYDNGYTAAAPLGLQATIDPHTGIISGIAPPVGKYVLGVKVLSYRNGILLNDHRKDFIINVSDCNFAGAQLNPRPVICNSFNVAFTNDNNSPLNLTYLWNFGDPKTGNLDTSSLPSPTHVYSDTGVYVYQLIVNPGQQCRDSTTQIVKVYPGFFPAFSIDGECINSSILFTDNTRTKYGTVSGWSWNFGDPSSSSDTSDVKNPSYVYTTPGDYPVELTATSSKGCVKSITDTVPIKAKPNFKVNNDTLICSIDTLQLTSVGTGTVTWAPNYNINNPNSFTPLVSPKVPTTYYATLVESRGCSATDSVFVNVVSKVSLNLPPDTTICLTDTVTINTVSDGLHYLWSPARTIINDTSKYAQVIPAANTTYHVVSSIGKCNTSGNIAIKVVPYPQAIAGLDTAICFPNSIQLHASGGSVYSWSPPNFLNDPNIANPVSTPQESIEYIVQVNDILGCPKPTFDTVLVNVEKIVADAGPRDTSVVVNQPLQLNGTGGGYYVWSPPNGLNDPDISDPVAILSESQQYILKVESAAGCSSTDTINITVYKVKPDLYVPDAFTPNGDGLNDIFKPIPIGMKSLTFFRVYNRLGQLVYSTNVFNQGWDGTFKGTPQDPAVFVWMAQGVDYMGNIISKKGTVTLIR
ncbi:MAG TPA: PKD domain-containing protein [Hanamia sp.]|nr:PKD domain-containing protein [Hanamia sp.]